MRTTTKRRQVKGLSRVRLEKALDSLSEEQMNEVIAFIASLSGSMDMPDPNEPPLTAEEEESLKEAYADISAGRVESLKDVLKELC